MNSVVISWLPPDDVEPEQIKGFSIRADGELKDMLIGTSRTKAIVSDVKRDKVEGFILIENVHSKVFVIVAEENFAAHIFTVSPW